ncbi:Superkiller viralicidic activity 2-like 2 [Artemisia annua]|uniref:Superkiller viralicidic activity 2-like 2 n=1 Tax=Artemisia annua TaxID=35608 RepID=A0A2U1PSQ5_ARTAN|nr:Superkiller viralicidic activity 2-like 2 [Artemisia annua]
MENATNDKKRKASETSTKPRRVVARNSFHDVAVPRGYISSNDASIHGTLSNPVFNGNMAKSYPFKLDTFQLVSLSCLERQESVLVSAHTSAGKTTVVEYVIAMALRDKEKVIYTSPLKALSHQKFIEFDKMFSDVGLMTDVSLSPTASCLVMTTEILRETPCHVVKADSRPTPLHHYAYPVVVGEKILLLNEDKQFIEANFLKLENDLTKLTEEKQKQLKWDREIHNVVKMASHANHLPIIIFSFSRKECEEYAVSLSGYNFNTKVEETSVENIFQNATRCLCEEDRNLSAIRDMPPFLKRGIAAHHCGLLPIIKELVEILFRKGLVKVVFATETFVMGLNMPAKTVVLTSAKKWDGDSKRYVGAGEYIQMSGIAGHRGQDEQDEHGESIIMIDEQIEMDTLRDMVLGEPAPLVSTFRLSFNLVLNLMGRSDRQRIAEDVIQNSFHQFQYKKTFLNIGEMIEKLEEKVAKLNASGGADAAEYNKLKLEHSELEKKMFEEIMRKQYLRFLDGGRLVKVEEAGRDFGWGVVVCVKRTGSNFAVDTLVRCSIGSSETGSCPKLCPPCTGQDCEMQLVSLPFSSLSAMGEKIKLPSNYGSLEARQSTLLKVRELEKCSPHGLRKVNPVEEGFHDPVFVNLVEQIEKLGTQLLSHPSIRVQEVRDKIQQLKTKKADSQLEEFRVELRNRSQVLETLEHIDAQGILTVKGHAARLICTGDELLAIEFMYNATFNDLDHHEIAALASCFMPGDTSRKEIRIRSKLAKPFEELQATARRIAEIQNACKLEVDVEEYVEATVRPFLMDVMYCWSTGGSFFDITEMTDIFEGDVIHLARRLDEFLNQLRDAARAVGKASLEEKFNAASESIHRGALERKWVRRSSSLRESPT